MDIHRGMGERVSHHVRAIERILGGRVLFLPLMYGDDGAAFAFPVGTSDDTARIVLGVVGKLAQNASNSP